MLINDQVKITLSSSQFKTIKVDLSLLGIVPAFWLHPSGRPRAEIVADLSSD